MIGLYQRLVFENEMIHKTEFVDRALVCTTSTQLCTQLLGWHG